MTWGQLWDLEIKRAEVGLLAAVGVFSVVLLWHAVQTIRNTRRKK